MYAVLCAHVKCQVLLVSFATSVHVSDLFAPRCLHVINVLAKELVSKKGRISFTISNSIY